MKTATLSAILISGLIANSIYAQSQPVITEEPSNVVTSVGRNVVLHVKATGTPAPKYQWQFDGSNITKNASSRMPNLALGAADSAIVGAYAVLVFNDQGTNASDSVTVTLVPPKPAITSPRDKARVTDSSFTVSGTTTPNSGVTSVEYAVNGAGPTTATQLNTRNWNNWQAPVVLTQAGSNQVQVWAVGSSGSSLTNTATYFLLVTNPLTIAINGSGSVTPNLNGKELIIGQSYTITAVPGPGEYFDGWSGSLTVSNPKLNFVMQSNMLLTAMFIANPFTNNDLAGTYDGLFSQGDSSSDTNSGYLTLTLTGGGKNAGTFFGEVWVDGGMYSFKGQRLSATGTAQVTISRRAQKKGDLIINPILDLSGASGLTGSVASAGSNGTGAFVSSLQAYRTYHHAATHYEGNYTWAMNGAGTGDPNAAPQGYNFGAANVDINGTVRMPIIYLSDGSQATFSGALDENGYLPLYTHYTSRKYGSGTLMGWVLFTNTAPTTNYATSWFKDSDPHAPDFTNGFTLTDRTILLAPYKAPHTGTNALGATNATVQLFGADLPATLNEAITLSAKGISVSNDTVKVTISDSTGLFSGWFVDPTTSDTNHFSGAVLEAPQNGFGNFLTIGDTNRLSGSVVLFPTP